ncbi:MAG TPA: VOC family protein [Streptosporangiaceae bacterium]|nr:VOC family protein [Streptosporangiaceae bacterium]
MVQRDTPWPAGTPCWVDLGADDVARATAFYATLFGWETQAGPPESGGYVMCQVHGRPVAGIGPKMGPPEAPTAWTTYIATDDADLAASKISAAGGHLVAEPFEVMDVGRMCVAADPGGAIFGIWQARAHSGFQLANEPGTVCWNENMSRDFAANENFYRAIFGYSYNNLSAGDFRYATFKTTGNPLGGIGDLGTLAPADTPAHWRTYFGVNDTDEAVEIVTKLGGNVLAPAWDSPYGRMAIVSDDQGAVFALMSIAAAGGE